MQAERSCAGSLKWKIKSFLSYCTAHWIRVVKRSNTRDKVFSKYLEICTTEAFGIVLNTFGNLVLKYEHVITIQLKQSLETRITECLLHLRLYTAKSSWLQ